MPSRLSHVKMRPGWVTPSTIIARKSKIWRAEVCCSNGNRCSFNAPFWVRSIVTNYLVTLPTRCTVIEQCRAQCRCPSPVPSWVQISIPTSSTYIYIYILTDVWTKQNKKIKKKKNTAEEQLLTHCARSITATIKSCMSTHPSRSCESTDIC